MEIDNYIGTISSLKFAFKIKIFNVYFEIDTN